MNIGNKIKIISIVSSCIILDVFLHMLTAPFSTMPDNPNLSFVAKFIGVEAAATFWAFLAFSVVNFVFLRFRERIPGEGVRKGLCYGASVALLWFLAMLEGAALFGNSIIKEIVVGLSDAIPVFLLSIFLGYVKPCKGSATYSMTGPPVRKHKVIALFAAIFLAGRYLAYTTDLIKSGIQERPIGTFMWTLLMGIAIGTSFVWLEAYRRQKSFRRRVGEFTLCFFGMNWFAFLMFMPLLFSGYIMDVLIRMAIDISLVTIASYLTISTEGVSCAIKF